MLYNCFHFVGIATDFFLNFVVDEASRTSGESAFQSKGALFEKLLTPALQTGRCGRKVDVLPLVW